jgi:PIN domain nuclease of toxin-antitoxin system
VPAPVLDAHALMAYLEREQGYKKIIEHLSRALTTGESLPMAVVNLGEILYLVRREKGAARAAEIEGVIRSLPIIIIDVDIVLTREAARFKARGGISYADSFACALAHLRQTSVLTGDPEFKAVEDEVTIDWL